MVLLQPGFGQVTELYVCAGFEAGEVFACVCEGRGEHWSILSPLPAISLLGSLPSPTVPADSNSFGYRWLIRSG